MKRSQQGLPKPKRYDCFLWEEDGEWTAHNPDIGAFGVGPSRKAALADFAVAAKLMLKYLH